MRDAYIAVYDGTKQFLREWSVYATDDGNTVLPSVREQMESQPDTPIMPIFGVAPRNRMLCTQIMTYIVDHASDDKAYTEIATMIAALIAICKVQPYFLLRLDGENLRIEHIDVVHSPSQARRVMLERRPEIASIAPPEIAVPSST